MLLRNAGIGALCVLVISCALAPAVAAPPTCPQGKPQPTQTTTITAPAPQPTQPTATAPVTDPPPNPVDPQPTAPAPAEPVATSLGIAVAMQETGLLLISGQLLDAAGASVAGAEVTLSFDGVAYLTVVTGADGAWQSSVDPAGALVAGSHTFEGAFAGTSTHLPSHGVTTLQVGPRTTVVHAASDPTTFTSGAHLTIWGSLTDDAGAPVPGARVKAGIDDAAGESGSALTGPDGGYSFTVRLPDTDTARPLTIHVHFDGDPAFLASNVTIPGNLAPRTSASPSPSATPSASPSPTPTTPPASATPTASVSAKAQATGGGIPGLGWILAVFAASLGALAVLGVLAYRWHRRN